MSGNVLVLAEHEGKQISDGTYELLGAARGLAAALGGTAEVALFGPRDLAAQLGGADVVVSVDHPALAEYLPEAYEQALLAVLEQRSPRLLLISTATPGLDLGAALAVRWQAPLAAYVTRLEAADDAIVATAQILGGKVLAELELTGERAIAAVIGGAFPAAAGQGAGTPDVVDVAPPAGLDRLRMSLLAGDRAASRRRRHHHRRPARVGRAGHRVAGQPGAGGTSSATCSASRCRRPAPWSTRAGCRRPARSASRA